MSQNYRTGEGNRMKRQTRTEYYGARVTPECKAVMLKLSKTLKGDKKHLIDELVNNALKDIPNGKE
jgi:hypothetical protein